MIGINAPLKLLTRSGRVFFTAVGNSDSFSISGLASTVQTSTDLVTWTPDAGSAESIVTAGEVEP